MTDRRSLSYALALVRLDHYSTPARVLSLLAAEPSPTGVGFVEISRRDMASWLGVSESTASRALARLVADRVVEIVEPARGTSAKVLRVRPPEEWGAGVPWATDRRDAARRLLAHRAATDGPLDTASPRAQARALRLLGSSPWRAGSDPAARALRRAGYGAPSARAQARGLAPAPTTHSPESSADRPREEGGREIPLPTPEAWTPAERELVGAFEATNLCELRGRPLRRVRQLALDVRPGHVDALRVWASTPAPGRWLDHIAAGEAIAAARVVDELARRRGELRAALNEAEAYGATDEAASIRAELAELAAAEA